MSIKESMYIRILNDDPLPDLSYLKPFKAVVIIEELVSTSYQDHVSRWLVDQGCRFMCAWGLKCSEWDDSVDYANIEQFDHGEIPEQEFVMTTWHEDEELSEVFAFAKFLMPEQTIKKLDDKFGEHTIPYKKVLLLHIGSEQKEHQFSELYQLAEW